MNIESKRRRRESDEVIAQHSLPTVTNWRRLLSERLATLPISRPNCPSISGVTSTREQGLKDLQTRFLLLIRKTFLESQLLLDLSVALLLKKIDWEMYRPELLQRLRDDKLWGIYAVSYDTILSDFPPYRQIIDDVLRGVSPSVGRVLELGAGTGNVTKALLQRGYTVTALENNPFMLEKMCAKKLDQNRGLTINLESAESLDLIDQDNFDAAVAVNVAYAFDDPLGCFRNVAQLLKPNGVFVLSTTHSETDLDPLLKAIESHLKATGTFKEKEKHYRRVVEVNRDIQYSIARRYTREEYEQWLDQAGFRITYEKSSYKDAVIVIHARKARD